MGGSLYLTYCMATLLAPDCHFQKLWIGILICWMASLYSHTNVHISIRILLLENVLTWIKPWVNASYQGGCQLSLLLIKQNDQWHLGGDTYPSCPSSGCHSHHCCPLLLSSGTAQHSGALSDTNKQTHIRIKWPALGLLMVYYSTGCCFDLKGSH